MKMKTAKKTTRKPQSRLKTSQRPTLPWRLRPPATSSHLPRLKLKPSRQSRPPPPPASRLSPLLSQPSPPKPPPPSHYPPPTFRPRPTPPHPTSPVKHHLALPTQPSLHRKKHLASFNHTKTRQHAQIPTPEAQHQNDQQHHQPSNQPRRRNLQPHQPHQIQKQ